MRDLVRAFVAASRMNRHIRDISASPNHDSFDELADESARMSSFSFDDSDRGSSRQKRL